MKLTVYTDGASRGNPGESAYGFCIKDDKGKVLAAEGEYIGVATNNFAEYSAVLHALAYVEKHFKGLEVIFLIDSKLVVEQLSGKFKIKSASLKPLIQQIKEQASKLDSVSFRHIPREKNKLADLLANRALDAL